MNIITVCYSTHRPETLGLTAGIMQHNDVIILEEPLHADFTEVLSGCIDIEDHLLELDVGYPLFTKSQYRLLKKFSQEGKKILQVEPYLEMLLGIQYFLAEDHSPEEIEPGSAEFSVYSAERDATAKLINYYEEVRGNNFEGILSSMNSFAKADAARFVLRDTLRANRIIELLAPEADTYIEAGSIHLLFHKLLAEGLPEHYQLQARSIDREALRIMQYRGTLFSPGDKLTLFYIFGRNVSRRMWEMYCARSLIYSKIVIKEELSERNERFPHTLNEIESIAAVRQLPTETCKILFHQIRTLSSEEAADVVKFHLRGQ